MDTNTSPVVDADQIAAQAKHDANAKKYALNIAALIATLLVGYFVHILAGFAVGIVLGGMLAEKGVDNRGDDRRHNPMYSYLPTNIFFGTDD